MTIPKSGKQDAQAPPAGSYGSGAPRRYEKPRVIDYGAVSKLTQTGSQTTRDNGNMFRPCL